MDEITFVASGRGGRRAIVQGFIYTKHRNGTTGSFWHCIKRHEKCQGRIRINDAEDAFVVVKAHDHVPNFGEAKAVEVLSRAKDRARNEPHTIPSVITQQVIGEADSETLVALPKETSIKKVIKRIRKENQPPLPVSLNDMNHVPGRFSYVDGEHWLLHDTGVGEDRVIMFARARTLRTLCRSQMWYMDGTFKSRPLIVAQLYVIHYEMHGQVVPGVYALMENRREYSYRQMFEVLRDRFPEASRNGPARISTDFEVAAKTAFREVFPNSREAYCFYHFSQSLWRTLQSSGHSAEYMQLESEEFRAQFHAIISLAFVREDDVQEAFLLLREKCFETLDDVLDLLEDYYVLGKRRGRGRTAPRYPIPTWNVFERTLQGVSRTNNTCEGWNRRFNSLIGKFHPNLHEFLDALMEEERYSEGRRQAIDLGEEPTRKKKKYAENDTRIERIVGRYGTYKEEQDNRQGGDWDAGLLKYMRTIGHAARGIFEF